MTEHTDVLIVGAGPTGLTAAGRLALHGVPHVLLDAAPAATATSKASLVHASTLELLAELGIADDLVAAGQVVRRIVMADRGRVLLTVSFERLATRYAFALGVPQSVTEALLLRRHVDLGGSVRRRHRVTAVTADGDRHVVTGTAETADGSEPFTIITRYVIGADGAHSAVRSTLGLDFPGETYAAQFALADVRLTSVTSADDLATRIAAVLAHRADDSSLDGYERARRPAALEVLRFTDRTTRAAMLGNPVARTLRRAAMGTVGCLRPVRSRIANSVAGLQRSPLRDELPILPPAASERTPS